MGSPLRGVEEPRDGVAIARLFRRGQLLLGILLVALVAGSYWVKTRPAPASPLEATQAAQMKAGLDALGRDDPRAAAEHFRTVLALYPSHYGATFQLATALDRAGRGEEARPYWEKMLPLAEAADDNQTLATVRARLRRRDVPSEGDLMRVGLDALYDRDAPTFMVSPSFIGVELPPGAHSIRAEYRTGLLKTSLLVVSGLTLFAVIAFRRRFAHLERVWAPRV